MVLGVETLRGTGRRCICSRHSYLCWGELKPRSENQRQETWISLSFPDFLGSSCLAGLQPMNTHPPRVPSTAGKPSDALTFPWPFQARQGAKRLRRWSSLHLVGVSLSSSGACPARAFSLLFTTPPLLARASASTSGPKGR